jgi:hypothetical protein
MWSATDQHKAVRNARSDGDRARAGRGCLDAQVICLGPVRSGGLVLLIRADPFPLQKSFLQILN